MIQFDVFVSYSSQDKAVADAAVATLEAAGIRCWIAPRDIVPGSDWGGSIVEAIDQCQVMALIFSANANVSPQIRREVERAVSNGKAIIPVRIEDVQPTQAMAYFMGSVHWLDALSPPLEAHLQRLVGSTRALLAMRGNSATVPGPSAAAKPLPAPPATPSPAANREVPKPGVPSEWSPLPQWQILLLLGVGIATFIGMVSLLPNVNLPRFVIAGLSAFGLVTLVINWFFPDVAYTNLAVKIATMALCGTLAALPVPLFPFLIFIIFYHIVTAVLALLFFALYLACIFYLAGKALSWFKSINEIFEEASTDES